mmetsp:Transcript_10849/g.31365  ORF Transcript_10849/g.31365 Transcript_10849/m.31365 type:complete len:442 (+) Transcript_10849:303-1628(+)
MGRKGHRDPLKYKFQHLRQLLRVDALALQKSHARAIEHLATEQALVERFVGKVEGTTRLLHFHRQHVRAGPVGGDDLQQTPRSFQHALRQQKHDVVAPGHVPLQVAQVLQILRIEEHGGLHDAAHVGQVLQIRAGVVPQHPREHVLHQRRRRAGLGLVVRDEHEVVGCLGILEEFARGVPHPPPELVNCSLREDFLLSLGQLHLRVRPEGLDRREVQVAQREDAVAAHVLEQVAAIVLQQEVLQLGARDAALRFRAVRHRHALRPEYAVLELRKPPGGELGRRISPRNRRRAAGGVVRCDELPRDARLQHRTRRAVVVPQRAAAPAQAEPKAFVEKPRKAILQFELAQQPVEGLGRHGHQLAQDLAHDGLRAPQSRIHQPLLANPHARGEVGHTLLEFVVRYNQSPAQQQVRRVRWLAHREQDHLRGDDLLMDSERQLLDK